MNPKALRGLAALVLLCCGLSRVSAVPVTLLSESRYVKVRHGDPELPLAVTSITPTSPFAPFDATANGGGATTWQQSAITNNSIHASGYYSASTLFPATRNYYTEPSSYFGTTFQVVEPVAFALSSYRELGVYGTLDVVFSGPDMAISLSGMTPYYSPNNYSIAGVLQPGVYSLSVSQFLGLQTLVGPTYNGTSGKYNVSLILTPTTFVTDGGHSASIFGATAGVLLFFAHRRRIRTFPGV